MEKKVPERKVILRDEDVFYVYDKRINKCIKEDCEGTVKYGLVLRVNTYGEETCNSFECNKCHMKYTPYPNYVRLTKTDMLTIYNKEEVEARDRKRAEDAMKQAARDRKKQGRKFTPNRDGEQGADARPYAGKRFERRPYEKKSYGKSYERTPYERKSYDRSSFDKNSTERGSYERKSYDRKPYERNSYEKRPYNNEGRAYDKKPYDRGYSERGSYERKSYDKKPYDGKKYESRSYEARPNGERPQGTTRKSNIVITTNGYRKPFRSDLGHPKNHQ